VAFDVFIIVDLTLRVRRHHAERDDYDEDGGPFQEFQRPQFKFFLDAIGVVP